MRLFPALCVFMAASPAFGQFSDFTATRRVYVDVGQYGDIQRRESPDVSPLTYEANASFAPPGGELPISGRAFHDSSFSATQIIARGGTSEFISYGYTQRDMATGESIVWSSFRVAEPVRVRVSMTTVDPGASRVFDERGELIVPEDAIGHALLGMAWAVLSKPDCQLHAGQWGAADDCALLALPYRSVNVIDGDPSRVPPEVRARIEREMVFPIMSAAEIRQPRTLDRTVMLMPGEYMLLAQAVDFGLSRLSMDYPASFDVTITHVPEPATWMLAVAVLACAHVIRLLRVRRSG
jgi:hypothetical protein